MEIIKKIDIKESCILLVNPISEKELMKFTESLAEYLSNLSPRFMGTVLVIEKRKIKDLETMDEETMRELGWVRVDSEVKGEREDNSST